MFSLHLPTLLLLGAATMALAASVGTLLPLVQKVHRGYVWWVVAQWLAAGGVALQSGLMPQWPAAVAAMHALLLQWPVLMLIGLRRFHARHPLPTPAWLDRALLAAAYAGWALPWLFDAPLILRVAAFSIGAAVLHAWAASRLLSVDSVWDSTATRAFSLLLGVVAGVMLARGTYALLATDTREALVVLQTSGALTAMVVSLLSVYLTLWLTHERTERELRASRRRLRFYANIDSLTRVPNRRYFEQLARRTMKRHRSQPAVVMFDIDHFKQINDVLGHAAGDRALKLVSRCAQETLRTGDVAGRHGGDEFVLLLPGTTVQAAIAVASRITSRAQSQAERLGLPALSLSFGVVQMQAGESLDDAMRRADQALYEAKRQGRGRAVTAHGDEDSPVFSESMRLGLTPA